jgi:hypothetical protein
LIAKVEDHFTNNGINWKMLRSARTRVVVARLHRANPESQQAVEAISKASELR